MLRRLIKSTIYVGRLDHGAWIVHASHFQYHLFLWWVRLRKQFLSSHLLRNLGSRSIGWVPIYATSLPVTRWRPMCILLRNSWWVLSSRVGIRFTLNFDIICLHAAWVQFLLLYNIWAKLVNRARFETLNLLLSHLFGPYYLSSH